ncbi:S-adenosylmethionine mitochondrial carrier protein homolog [Anthonomus grandis grandis]|uniref:S-adenosylmethionine mitochondrial carrier protein homolog n=1 Tax=Anthonomus grandis grandis TaxID=2921223 RepID=UPI0021656303|nr:S-adenosylmethionine mitochondrial carrier protein homolog [Anthonomus grandis grandis]XP_050302944.1 S-adenosylmethionine mitochondrial carrier protein homolog [Anthonomus grandis grandis]
MEIQTIVTEQYNQQNMMWSAFLGGGAAGLFVDVVLFPLDTLKTRLQAEQGFKSAGGFRGIYKGLGPQLVGSAPQAALFFLTYESIKEYCEPRVPKHAMPLVYMFGASVAEVMACLVRVPMEVVKQRKQTSAGYKSSWKILMSAYKYEGFFKGVYRGFGSTIMREIPFSVIQFPTLEFCKSMYRTKLKNNIHLDSWEVAICGSLAGGLSAAITTPLDVVKTRIMLADRKTAKSLTFLKVFKRIFKREGIRGLFSGVVPRTLWIFLGGYIFFGSYDFAKNTVYEILEERRPPIR